MQVLEPEVLSITLLSLFIASTSTLFSSLLGVPLGALLGVQRNRFTRLFKTFTHALYGMPPVVAGLLIYLLLSRAGPLGPLGLLFTPGAMVIAQTFLVTPLVVGLVASAVAQVDPALVDTARTLGARGWPLLRTLLSEARGGIYSAVMVGFGRAISEVGAVILVGGNIQHHTRVLTTAIVLETQTGNFQFALTLGLILMLLAALVAVLLTRLQEEA